MKTEIDSPPEPSGEVPIFMQLSEDADRSEKEEIAWLISDVHEKLRRERVKKKIWMSFALIVLAAIIYNTKTRERWWPDLDDGTLRFEYSDWWGLSNNKYYPVWRKESAASPEDGERWCIRYPDGTWHTFIWRVGDAGPVDYYFPPKTNGVGK